MVKLSSTGDFSKVSSFLNHLDPQYIYRRLDHYGQMGVDALAAATPKDTGKTAESWSYRVFVGKDHASITWDNSNAPHGVPVALMIQYGHGMPNGGYVKGIDYINPALAPIFEEITETVWKEVLR